MEPQLPRLGGAAAHRPLPGARGSAALPRGSGPGGAVLQRAAPARRPRQSQDGRGRRRLVPRDHRRALRLARPGEQHQDDRGDLRAHREEELQDDERRRPDGGGAADERPAARRVSLRRADAGDLRSRFQPGDRHDPARSRAQQALPHQGTRQGDQRPDERGEAQDQDLRPRHPDRPAAGGRSARRAAPARQGCGRGEGGAPAARRPPGDPRGVPGDLDDTVR